MLMSLGDFIFEIATLAPGTIDTALNLSLPSHARHGKRPAVQFTGVESETARLAGVIYPASKITGTAQSLEQIKDMAKAGDEYVLAAADGYIKGIFRIKAVAEKATAHDKGGAAQKIEFTIDLTRTDNERIARL